MTSLPIDARTAPYRAKYLTEETTALNAWMIFGGHPDGTVDVHDGQQDIITNIAKDKAERLVAARKLFCDAVEQELCHRCST